MRSCGDKMSIYNEENKTKEDKSILVSTTENLFCSFIINDDVHISLGHRAIKMKIMHTYESQMALAKLEFSELFVTICPVTWGEWVRRINDKWRHGVRGSENSHFCDVVLFE